MVFLKLFGQAAVDGGGGAAGGLTSRRHPMALLCLLALSPSQRLGRGKAVGFLWPESPEAAARNRLTTCLYQVRKALGDEAVASAGDELCLNRDVISCDVHAFEEALAEGQCERAVEHYGGELLDGFWLRGAPEFEQWLESERDRLRRGYHDSLEALAGEAEHGGRLDSAARWWRARFSAEPYDTRVARRLLEVLAAAGYRGEALRVAKRHAKICEEEFGVGPDDEFRALVTKVQTAPAPPGPGSEPARPAALPATRIAVLPFENLSGTAEAEPFTDGLHHDLITELSRVSALSVISRSSVLRYAGKGRPVPEIARELGVGTVIDGGVQTSGGRLRLNVQLIDAHGGGLRWVERYERTLSMDDILGLQVELAESIAAALRAELTPAERDRSKRGTTEDLEAYRMQAHGRRYLDQRTENGMRLAVANFEEALARDPGYVLAWVGLADALSLLHDYGFADASAVLPRANEAVKRALFLDSTSAEAHTSLGLLSSNRHEGPAALAAFRRAVELFPGYAPSYNWLCWTGLVLGYQNEALKSARRAIELDPLDPETVSNLALSSLAAGDADAALREARRVAQLQPDWTTGPFYEALAHYHLGRHDEAAGLLDGLVVEWAGSGAELTFALARAAAGDRATARRILNELKETGDHYAAGVIHLALGETARGFEALKRTDPCLYWPILSLRHFYPDVLAPLRADPLGDALLRQMDACWGVVPGSMPAQLADR